MDDASPVKRLPVQPPPEQETRFRDTFSVDVSSGLEWVNLTDEITFWVSPEGFGQQQITWRREESVSRFYHGSHLVHATMDNVSENLSVYIRGETQNEVTEMIMMLEEIFSQPSYRVRVQFGDHRETWHCQTADWQVDRGHVHMHNHMAKMTFRVPRLPQTSKEIVL